MRGGGLTAAADFGAKLRDLRQQDGLSQADLAERLGVMQGRISRIENGLNNLTLSTCEELAAAMGAIVSVTLSRNDDTTAIPDPRERLLILERRIAATEQALETLTQTLAELRVERDKILQET